MGGPWSERDAWGMFCHDVAGWALFGHGALMVDRRDTGACVGQVGLNAGPLFPELEIGWLLYEAQERQGFAAEAAAALRDWATTTRELGALVSYINPANPRSIALAERLGAVLDPLARGKDPADLVYRHRMVPPKPFDG